MEFIQLNLLADSRSVYYYNSMSLTDMHILLCRYVLTYIYIIILYVCILWEAWAAATICSVWSVG